MKKKNLRFINSRSLGNNRLIKNTGSGSPTATCI